jgi:hypothetical protein
MNVRSWGNQYSIHAAKWMKKELGFDFRHGQEFFSSPQHPDQLCWPSCFLFSGHWRGSFAWCKAAEREAVHSPPHRDEVKHTRNHTSTLPHIFMAWHLNKLSTGTTFIELYRFICISSYLTSNKNVFMWIIPSSLHQFACGILIMEAQRENHVHFYNTYLLLIEEEYTDEQASKVCGNQWGTVWPW